ncbi:hypothetical protein DEU56DRAFT_476433 [Suillus clintonianus]|uniref:uncharacterized protein n=1 Tax=Suillus clintonianus TaxID=1904413 RepID=UPI001B876BB4|nr:uncharacterized protein DEU56DRAFT_476433 [Suillus clintonianus]KAG2153281.1 hypothetical protein DEU56DRAFT_476433 [Suillus clintonianus]
MGKLNLKRTPAEEAERALCKARKAAKKATKRSHLSEESSEHRESGSKRRRRGEVIDSDLDEDFYGPPPPPSLSSAHKPDYDTILSELEDTRFREKMWDALRDDERLDGIDARFNDYAHVPDRWRANGASGGSPADQMDMDPRFMDDDAYAEWIRDGMWRFVSQLRVVPCSCIECPHHRRKHARQYEEEAHKKAEKAARSARKKEMKAETAKLEKAAEERRKEKKRERESRREENARAEYDRKWKDLLDPNARHGSPLSFGDIPWPLFVPMVHSDTAHSDPFSITLEHFTTTAISAFLIPLSTISALAQDVGISLPTQHHDKKEKKEKLRETMLRFHPDKFEGRVMRRVIETDKDRVKEAVGQVARVLNTLMEE